MKIKCYQLSSAGALRDHNEDYSQFWEADDFDTMRQQGSLALLADGVGGEEHGEVASKMAVETALSVFKELPVQTTSGRIRSLWRTWAIPARI